MPNKPTFLIFLQFYLFMLVVPALVVITVGRYIGFLPAYKSMFLAELIGPVLLTLLYYLYYKVTGREVVLFRRWKTRTGKVLQVSLGVFAMVLMGICTFIWLEAINMNEPTIWVTAALSAIIAGGIYLPISRMQTPESD